MTAINLSFDEINALAQSIVWGYAVSTFEPFPNRFHP
jgi:hypothetical protein